MLLLPSLSIKNYRNLKSLEIESLARVNLIAGKNNTGKTSLLEAISFYASKGSLQWINRLLNVRDEFYKDSGTVENLMVYTSLFSDRIAEFSGKQRILIGPLKKSISEENEEFLKDRLNIRFVTLKEVSREAIDPKTNQTYNLTHKEVVEGDNNSMSKLQPGLVIGFDRSINIYDAKDLAKKDISSLFPIFNKPYNYQFVESQTTKSINDRLWDQIALTDKEDYVVAALRIIEPGTDRITFIKDEDTNQRTPVVKININKSVVPLKSMGDGMNRILTIILALVNAEKGFLLIDEFENGLHYTVQEDLWRMIFNLAKELNVQVFATTHSEDCIRAFAHVLNSKENQAKGQYFRLEKFGETIKPIFYNASELDIATDQDIEMR